MRRLGLIVALLMAVAPAWSANKKITVAQLKDMLVSFQQQPPKSDQDVATALKQVELTEELTRTVMNGLASALPGPLATEQLYVLEARSAMLAPPAADIPTSCARRGRAKNAARQGRGLRHQDLCAVAAADGDQDHAALPGQRGGGGGELRAAWQCDRCVGRLDRRQPGSVRALHQFERHAGATDWRRGESLPRQRQDALGRERTNSRLFAGTGSRRGRSRGRGSEQNRLAEMGDGQRQADGGVFLCGGQEEIALRSELLLLSRYRAGGHHDHDRSKRASARRGPRRAHTAERRATSRPIRTGRTTRLQCPITASCL